MDIFLVFIFKRRREVLLRTSVGGQLEKSSVGGKTRNYRNFFRIFEKTSGGPWEDVGRRTTRKLVGRGKSRNNRNVFRIIF